MNELRCYNCKKLLCKATGAGEIEIICNGGKKEVIDGSKCNCRKINYLICGGISSGLRGEEFHKRAVDLRCKCGKVLGKAIGDLKIESKCKSCNTIRIFDTVLMKAHKKFKFDSKPNLVKYCL